MLTTRVTSRTVTAEYDFDGAERDDGAEKRHGPIERAGAVAPNGRGQARGMPALGDEPEDGAEYRTAIEEAGLLSGPVDELPELEVLRMAVEATHPPPAPRAVRSSVDKWLADIEAAVKRDVQPKALYDKLKRTKPEFKGSYAAVKRAYRRLKRARGVQADDVVIPVETPAAEVAQVDFGYLGKLFDPETGRVRKAYVFVMVLGYSRHLFARVVFDQKTSTWLTLHVAAFEYFGGVPRVLVPDNLKAAVVRCAFGLEREKLALNRSYRELARFYGFKIDPTPPYSPEKKGKAESAVKYVKRNWFAASEVEDLDAANVDLADWLEQTANERVHGTTGRRPRSVFEEEEQMALLALPPLRYVPVVWKVALVHRDSHIEFEGRLYSVPWRTVGREVWMRASATSLEVYFEDTRIATHDRSVAGRRLTLDHHLPDYRGDLRHRTEPYWLERALRLGQEVAEYVQAVFESDDEVSKLRDVQAIVTLLEGYPPHRVANAVRRARFYENYTYQGMKRILREALDLQPLPTAVVPNHGQLEQPRFARTVNELLAHSMESPHEPN